MTAAPRWFDRRSVILLLVWMISAAYVLPFLRRGWIPTDEGVFARAAEGILKGGIPHRDFQETYTGALSYWNALAFKTLGVRLTSLRIFLLIAFLVFVPAVFAIASRFGRPWLAGLVAFLAVVWSVPNYFAASVSWYNLFLAAGGTLALLRHVETAGRRWLFLAGACAGVSCLFKIIGAQFFAAALLFLLYRERHLRPVSEGPAGGGGKVSGYLAFLATGLAGFLAVLMVTVRQQPGAMEFLNFVVPSATICGFLLWSEWREGGAGLRRRFLELARMVLPLSLGFVFPILLFLVPIAAAGALPDFARGTVVVTGRHVQSVRMHLPDLMAIWPAVPYTILLGAGSITVFRSRRRPLLALIAAAMVAVLWLSGESEAVYRVTWYSARFLGVSVVFAACLRLADAHRQGFWGPKTRQRIFLLACVVALTGLVQFPYPQPIYFCYFAPLVALAIFALVASEPAPPRLLHAGALAFYLLFAVLRANPVYPYNLGQRFERYEAPSVLDLPRAGGLLVPAGDFRVYGTLIPLLQEKSGGKPIYAGPDCAQVQFLSGLPDALAFVPGMGEPIDRPDAVFQALRKADARAVV
ncbi:MAG TPA: hypothetical protein VGQ32_12120, partial [Thermoanaerobaculia bacterium]|nr:hypothetical protein [Thermoanaerobaculia bacterium]